MSAGPLHTLGVAALAARLRAREVSAVELVQALSARIDAHAGLGAFLALSLIHISEPTRPY